MSPIINIPSEAEPQLAPESEMPAEFLLCVLSLETDGLMFSARVNDVTVFLNRTGKQSALAAKINPLLLPGSNKVVLSIGLPLPSSRGSLQGSSEPLALTLKLQEGIQGTDPGQTGI